MTLIFLYLFVGLLVDIAIRIWEEYEFYKNSRDRTRNGAIEFVAFIWPITLVYLVIALVYYWIPEKVVELLRPVIIKYIKKKRSK